MIILGAQQFEGEQGSVLLAQAQKLAQELEKSVRLCKMRKEFFM